MPLEFHAVTSGALRGFSASAPAGSVVGVAGDCRSGMLDLLSLAEAQGATVFDPPALATLDALGRAELPARLHDLRSQGRTVVLGTHELALLAELTDEVWWLREGALAAQGHPAEVLPQYERWAAREFRASAGGRSNAIAPSMRRGDGRATLLSMETLGAGDVPAIAWSSGEQVAVRVRVKFIAEVADPVVGILIRTRIGVEVYGTNTELEKVAVGPCLAGDEREVTFRFRCDLCPKEYTLTAASHDPDGVWHDWMEDAVAFTVADTRYTAGVANLRAAVCVAIPTSNRE